jgi:hypothetical protein
MPSLWDSVPTCLLTPDLRPGLINAVAPRLGLAGYTALLRTVSSSPTHTKALYLIGIGSGEASVLFCIVLARMRAAYGLRDWQSHWLCESRACVGWTLRLGTIVVVAILILVSKFEIGFGQAKCSHESIVRCDRDLSIQGVKYVRRHGGMEYLHVVASRGDMIDSELASCIGYSEVRRIHGDDDCAHLGVDVAEDIGNTGLVELDEARGSALVQPEIEALALEQRENIVEDRILVGKFYFASDGDYQKRGMETFVSLHQLRNL